MQNTVTPGYSDAACETGKPGDPAVMASMSSALSVVPQSAKSQFQMLDQIECCPCSQY